MMEFKEKRTYSEWRRTYEDENGIRILDDDGERQIYKEGRCDEQITYKEALKYLLVCTINVKF